MKINIKADWLAIAIHFIVGAIVGGAFSFLSLAKTGYAYRVSGENLIVIILCTSAMIGAGYALLQNEAWIGENYRIIPPIPPRHSLLSRIFLGGVAVVSVLLIFVQGSKELVQSMLV
ncbi:MAG: hypothetical protein HC904_13735 [Blastochloris sp.]|nr:hypothetical protein [Blastochloris sp.]